MKTLQFGCEADQMNGNTVTLTVPINSSFTIVALQLDLALMYTIRPWFLSKNFAEILGSVSIAGQAANTDWGTPVFTGTQFHGDVGGGTLAAIILKASPLESTSRGIVIPNLSIAVTPAQHLQCNMGHSGYPVDAEIQGVLFYE